MCTRSNVFTMDWTVKGASKHLTLGARPISSPLEDKSMLQVSKVCVCGSGSKHLFDSVPGVGQGSLGQFFSSEKREKMFFSFSISCKSENMMVDD